LRDPEHEKQRVPLNTLLSKSNIFWHGVKLNQPDWNDNSYCVAFSAEFRRIHKSVHLILNGYWEPLEFELPKPGDSVSSPWRRWIDTGLESPHDIVPLHDAPIASNSCYRAEARSVVMLIRDELKATSANQIAK
jgi:glycogen operon protein